MPNSPVLQQVSFNEQIPACCILAKREAYGSLLCSLLDVLPSSFRLLIAVLTHRASLLLWKACKGRECEKSGFAESAPMRDNSRFPHQPPVFLHSSANHLCEPSIIRLLQWTNLLLFLLSLFAVVPFWKTCTPLVAGPCNFRVTFPLFHGERLLLLRNPSFLFFTRSRSFFAGAAWTAGRLFSKNCPCPRPRAVV